MEQQEKKIIYKDYSEKIRNKLPEDNTVKTTDINEFIALINFCFQKQNNFFIDNFNKRVIKNIYLAYNKIKTNILNPNAKDVFSDISVADLKSMRFILINFVNNFDIIQDNNDNKELFEWVKKESIKRCLQYLNIFIK